MRMLMRMPMEPTQSLRSWFGSSGRWTYSRTSSSLNSVFLFKQPYAVCVWMVAFGDVAGSSTMIVF